MHDNPDMSLVHRDYSLTIGSLSNEWFEMIADVFVDRMVMVEEYHPEYHPLDHLDRRHTMDCQHLIFQSLLRLVLSKLPLLR